MLSLAWGTVSIPLNEVLRIIAGQFHASSSASDTLWANIIWQVRLPHILTAILAGASLSVSGILMQTLFRNPLADPFALGIQSGASLGVALIILPTAALGFSSFLSFSGAFGQAFAAGLGAFSVMLLVMATAKRVAGMTTLLVLGLLIGYVVGAMVSLLVYFSPPTEIRAFAVWGLGSFSGTTWTQLAIFIPVAILGCAATIGIAKPLNALLLGDQYAQSLGVSVSFVRYVVIGLTSLLAGVVTAFCGPIAFIGIAVPHLCRTLFQSADHFVLLPAVMLMGAFLALLADLCAHLPASALPLNAILALLGAPVIAWMIFKNPQLG